MKVIMGADAGGFELKNAIKEDLIKRGYDITDIDPDEPVLFQDAAKAVARGVQSKEFERGIAICGTGMGVSIICNKHRGVYAALAESIYQARRAKTVNNTNVLCMGGFIIGNEMGRMRWVVRWPEPGWKRSIWSGWSPRWPLLSRKSSTSSLNLKKKYMVIEAQTQPQ